jgi:hypothetical protein
MATDGPDAADLAARIERLERHNRWLWCAFLASLLAAALPCVLTVLMFRGGGAPVRASVVEARELYVVDDAGVRCGELTTEGDAAVKFLLRDARDMVRCSIGMYEDHGPAVYFYDRPGAPRVMLGIRDGAPMEAFWPATKGLPANLFLNGDVPIIGILDRTRGAAELALGEEGPHVTLWDREKKPIFSKP